MSAVACSINREDTVLFKRLEARAGTQAALHMYNWATSKDFALKYGDWQSAREDKKTPLADFVMNSGGAPGVDTLFHIAADKAGISMIRHWREPYIKAPANSVANKSYQEIYRMANRIDDPVDAEGLVLQYLAGGGLIQTSDVVKVLKTSKTSSITYASTKGKTMEAIAHSIWDNLPEQLRDRMDTQDLYNALETVMLQYETRLQAATEFVTRYTPKNEPSEPYETEVDSADLRALGVAPTYVDPVTYEEGRVRIQAIANRLGRRISNKYAHYQYRNWAQVVESDAVFAVAFLDGNTVMGGTAYAVEAGKELGKPVFVFDPRHNSWFHWSKDATTGEMRWKKLEFGEVPILTERFAGVGTRFKDLPFSDAAINQYRKNTEVALEQLFKVATEVHAKAKGMTFEALIRQDRGLRLTTDETQYTDGTTLFDRISDLKPEPDTAIDAAYAERGTFIDGLLRRYLTAAIPYTEATFEAFQEEAEMYLAELKKASPDNYNILFTENFYKELLNAFMRISNFLKSNNLTVLADVPPLRIKLGDKTYGGTIDLLVMAEDGTKMVIDIKVSMNSRRAAYQSNSFIYRENDQLQLNAYREGIRQATGEDITRLAILPLVTPLQVKPSETTGPVVFDSVYIDQDMSTGELLLPVSSDVNIYNILGLEDETVPVKQFSFQTDAEGRPTAEFILKAYGWRDPSTEGGNVYTSIIPGNPGEVFLDSHQEVFTMQPIEMPYTDDDGNRLMVPIRAISAEHAFELVKALHAPLEMFNGILPHEALRDQLNFSKLEDLDYDQYIQDWKEYNNRLFEGIDTAELDRKIRFMVRQSKIMGNKALVQMLYNAKQFYAPGELELLQDLSYFKTIVSEGYSGITSDMLKFDQGDMVKGIALKYETGVEMEYSDFTGGVQLMEYQLYKIFERDLFRKNTDGTTRQIGLQTLRAQIHSRLVDTRNAYVKQATDMTVREGDTRGEIQRAKLRAYAANINKLFLHAESGKQVFEEILTHVLRSNFARDLGITREMEDSEDELSVTNNEQAEKAYNKTTFEISSHKTASNRLRSILSTVVDRVSTRITPTVTKIKTKSIKEFADGFLNDAPSRYRVPRFRNLVNPTILVKRLSTMDTAEMSKTDKLYRTTIYTPGAVVKQYVVERVDVLQPAEILQVRSVLEAEGYVSASDTDEEVVAKIKGLSYQNDKGETQVEKLVVYVVKEPYSGVVIDVQNRINSFGVPQFVPYQVIFNKVAATLHSIPDLTIGKAIAALYESKDPHLQSVAQLFDPTLPKSRTNQHVDNAARNEFIKLMMNQHPVFYKLLHKVETRTRIIGGVPTEQTRHSVFATNSAASSMKRNVINDWKLAQRYAYRDVRSLIFDKGAFVMNQEVMNQLKLQAELILEDASTPAPATLSTKEAAVFIAKRNKQYASNLVDLMTQVLDAHGISYNNEMISELVVKATKSTAKDFLGSSLSGAPNSWLMALIPTDGTNPLETEQSHLEMLAAAYIKYSPNLYLRAFIKNNGSIVWPHVNGHYLDTTVKEVKTKAYKDNLMKDPFFQGNPWLFDPIKVDQLNSIEMLYDDGVNELGNSMRGRDREMMGKAESEFESLGLFFHSYMKGGQALFQSFQHGDRHIMPLFRMKYERKNEAWTVSGNKLIPSQFAIQSMVDTFQMEWNRILAEDRRGSDIFYMIPELNFAALMAIVNEEAEAVKRGDTVAYQLKAEHVYSLYNTDGTIKKDAIKMVTLAGSEYNNSIVDIKNNPILTSRILPKILNRMFSRQYNSWVENDIYVGIKTRAVLTYEELGIVGADFFTKPDRAIIFTQDMISKMTSHGNYLQIRVNKDSTSVADDTLVKAKRQPLSLVTQLASARKSNTVDKLEAATGYSESELEAMGDVFIQYVTPVDKPQLLVDTKVVEQYEKSLRAATILTDEELTKEERIRIGRLADRAILMDFVVHQFVFTTQVLPVFLNDPARAYKASKETKNKVTTPGVAQYADYASTMTSYIKRNAGALSSGLRTAVSNWRKPYIKTLMLQDPKFDNSELSSIEGYNDLAANDKGADGTELLTVQEYLDTLHAEGLIRDTLYDEMSAIVQANKGRYYAFTDPKHLEVFINANKPVYYGLRIGEHAVHTDFVKSAATVLYPPALGTAMNKLRAFMELNDYDRAHFESARKLGGTGAVPFVNKDNEFDEAGFNDSSHILSATTMLDRKFLITQQYVPAKDTDTTTMSTQADQNISLDIEELFPDPIPMKWSGRMFNGEQLVRMKETAKVTIVRDQVNRLMSDPNLVNPLTGTIDAVKLMKSIVDRTQDLTDAQRSMLLSTKPNIASFTDPAIGMMLHGVYPRLTGTLMKMINKALTVKLPGMQLVQATSAGQSLSKYEQSTGPLSTDIIYMPGYDPTSRLKTATWNQGNNTVVEAEVILSQYMRDENGELIDLMQFATRTETENGTILILNTDTIPEQLRRLIAIRIPNASKNMMLIMKVVGFLPSNVINQAIVPADLARQMGSDFDLDKLTFYRYNHILKGQQFALDNSTNIKEAQNTYVEIFDTILSRPEVYPKMMETLETDDMEELNHKYGSRIPAGSMFERTNLNEEYIRQRDGLSLVSIFAKMVGFNYSMFRSYLPLQEMIERDGFPEVSLAEFNLFADGTGQPIVYRTVSGRGSRTVTVAGKTVVRTKSDNAGALLNSSLDYTNKRELDGLNLNEQTASIVSALLWLTDQERGTVNNIAALEQIVLFMKQPIVVEYAKRSANVGSPMFYSRSGVRLMDEIATQVFGKVSLSEVGEQNKGTFFTDDQLRASINSKELKTNDQLIVLAKLRQLYFVGEALRQITSSLDINVNGLGKSPTSAITKLRNASLLLKNSTRQGYNIGNTRNLILQDPLETTEQLSFDELIEAATERGAYYFIADKLFNELAGAVLPLEFLKTSVAAIQLEFGLDEVKDEVIDDLIKSITAHLHALPSTAIPKSDMIRRATSGMDIAMGVSRLKQMFPSNPFVSALEVTIDDNTSSGYYSAMDAVVRVSVDMTGVTDGADTEMFDAFRRLVETGEDIRYSPDDLARMSAEDRSFVKDLMTKMILSSIAFGDAAQNKGFSRFLTTSVYDKLGITANLDAAHEGMMAGRGLSDVLRSSTFVQQFAQHFPRSTQRVPAPNDYIISRSKLPDVKGEYFHDLRNGEPRLYKYNAEMDSFVRIGLLGNFGRMEWGSVESLWKSNNISGDDSFVLADELLLPEAQNIPFSTQFDRVLNRKGTSADLLDHIIQDRGLSDDTRAAARIVKSVQLALGTSYGQPLIQRGTLTGEFPAIYNHRSRIVTIDVERSVNVATANNLTLQDVVLHEVSHDLMHAAVLKTASPSSLLAMDQLINYAKAEAEKAGLLQDFDSDGRVFSDRFEFMNQVFTSPRFARWLNEIKDPAGTSWWTRFVAFLQDLLRTFSQALGFDVKTDSALFRVLNIYADIVQKEASYSMIPYEYNGKTYLVHLRNNDAISVTTDGAPWILPGKTAENRTSLANAVIAGFYQTQQQAAPVGNTTGMYPRTDLFGQQTLGRYHIVDDVFGDPILANQQQRYVLDNGIRYLSAPGKKAAPLERTYIISGPKGVGKKSTIKKLVEEYAHGQGYGEEQVMFVTSTKAESSQLFRMNLTPAMLNGGAISDDLKVLAVPYGNSISSQDYAQIYDWLKRNPDARVIVGFDLSDSYDTNNQWAQTIKHAPVTDMPRVVPLIKDVRSSAMDVHTMRATNYGLLSEVLRSNNLTPLVAATRVRTVSDNVKLFREEKAFMSQFIKSVKNDAAVKSVMVVGTKEQMDEMNATIRKMLGRYGTYQPGDVIVLTGDTLLDTESAIYGASGQQLAKLLDELGVSGYKGLRMTVTTVGDEATLTIITNGEQVTSTFVKAEVTIPGSVTNSMTDMTYMVLLPVDPGKGPAQVSVNFGYAVTPDLLTQTENLFVHERFVLSNIWNQNQSKFNSAAITALTALHSNATNSLAMLNSSKDVKAEDISGLDLLASMFDERAPMQAITEEDRNLVSKIAQQLQLSLSNVTISGFGFINPTARDAKAAEKVITPQDRLMSRLINQRQTIEDNIRKTQSVTTIESYRELSRSINELMYDIKRTKDLSALGKIPVIARIQMNWVKNLFSGGKTFLSDTDLVVASKITSLWSDYTKIVSYELLDPEAVGTEQDGTVRGTLPKDLVADADTYYHVVMNAIVERMNDTINNPNVQVTRNDLSKIDMGDWLGLQTRALANAPQPAIAFAANMVKQAAISEEWEFDEFSKELQALNTELASLGGNEVMFNKFTTPTYELSDGKVIRLWGFRSETSAEYDYAMSTAKSNYYKAIRGVNNSATYTPRVVARKTKKAAVDYRKAVAKYNHIINLGAFVQELPDGSFAINSKEFDVYLSKLGLEGQRSEILGKVNRILASYTERRLSVAAMYREMKSSGAFGPDAAIAEDIRLTKMKEWNEMFNPLNSASSNSALGPDQEEFMLIIPRTEVDGEKMYDQVYMDMVNSTDPKVKAQLDWVSRYRTLINGFLNSVPEHERRRISPNFLPIVSEAVAQIHDRANGIWGSLTDLPSYYSEGISASSFQTDKMLPTRLATNYLFGNTISTDAIPFEGRSRDLMRILEIFGDMAIHYKHMSLVSNVIEMTDTMIRDASRLGSVSNTHNMEVLIKSWEYMITKVILRHPQPLQGKISDKGWKRMPIDVRQQYEQTRAEVENLTALQADLIQDLNSSVPTLKNPLTYAQKKLRDKKKKQKAEIDAQLKEAKKRLDDWDAIYKNRKVYASKIADEFIKIGQVKAFALNPISGMVNLAMAWISADTWFAGRDDVSEHTWSEAFSEVFSGRSGNNLVKKLTAFAHRANLFGEATKIYLNQSGLREKESKIDWFWFMRVGDNMVRLSILNALMKESKHGVEINGKKVPLIDLLQEDGSIKTDVPGWGGKDIKKLSEFISKTIRTFDPIIGNVDQRTPVSAKGNWFYRLLGQFRLSWMPEGIAARWAGYNSHDFGLQRATKGRYRSFIDLEASVGDKIRLALRSIFTGKSKYSPDFFEGLKVKTGEMELVDGKMRPVLIDLKDSQVDLSNMYRNMRGLRNMGLTASFISVLFAIQLALAHALGEEKRKKRKKGEPDPMSAGQLASSFAMTAFNILSRSWQDQLFYASPMTMMSITRDVIPAVSVMQDMVNFATTAQYKLLASTIRDDNKYNWDNYLLAFTKSGIIPQLAVINKLKNYSERSIFSYNR